MSQLNGTSRVIDGWIQVVNVQGSIFGGKFAINLSLQPIDVPDVTGTIPNPKKITGPECEFTARLSISRDDQWWSHDSSQASMDAAVAAAAQIYIQ